MRYLDERRPFRINYKSKKDLTIFSVRDGVLCVFFRNDWGWLNIPDEMYNRTWSDIKKKGVTYISDEELQKLSQEFANGNELLK
ncbi:hypothetical protein [Streptococcus danieliae]|uniref:Uncharacterized protein n=1 Tax=Streptococcus danieliae TaxID=747656 RepID=A0A7Z0S6D0_9STRE|nr:hypothetical protein [Streptococcus danieliae]MBF0699444.1 hypothetical protein [Streptococcus danieliae]NYS96620.1 hypothetical protein [Streptococcus danieliae]